jgi:hypothetical protein
MRWKKPNVLNRAVGSFYALADKGLGIAEGGGFRSIILSINHNI